MGISPLVNFYFVCFSDQTVMYQLVIMLSTAVQKFEAVLRYHCHTAEIVARQTPIICFRVCRRVCAQGVLVRLVSLRRVCFLVLCIVLVVRKGF